MNMTKTHSFALLLALSTILLGGCAPRQQAVKPLDETPLTESAQLDYDYLVYQDFRARLHKITTMPEDGTEEHERVREMQAEAVAALDRVIEKVPTPGLFVEKAGLYWGDTKGLKRARTALTDGLALYPDDPLLNYFYANSWLMENNHTKASEVMNEYLERNPGDLEGRERLGRMLLDAQLWAQALDELNKIPENDRTADTLYAIARAQGKLGIRKEAVKNLQEAIHRDPDFVEALAELAFQYELMKDYVAAEESYERILDLGDTRPQVRLRLITLNLKMNNADKALRVAMGGPQSKAFILDAVLAFLNEKFYAQGATVLDILGALNPEPPEYWFYKAVIASEGENDVEKALDYLGRIPQNDKFHPQALYFQAQLADELGKDEDALSLARLGREQYPDSDRFYRLESQLLFRAGDYAGARRSLTTAIGRLGEDPALVYDMGILLEKMGEPDEAIALMERTIKEHPENADILNFLGYALTEAGRDLDRALVLVKRALSLDPDNGFIMDSVAWAHFKLGQLENAWQMIRQAVEYVDGEPTIWEHYGDIAKALGKEDEARSGYSRALELQPENVDELKGKLEAL